MDPKYRFEQVIDEVIALASDARVPNRSMAMILLSKAEELSYEVVMDSAKERLLADGWSPED